MDFKILTNEEVLRLFEKESDRLFVLYMCDNYNENEIEKIKDNINQIKKELDKRKIKYIGNFELF